MIEIPSSLLDDLVVQADFSPRRRQHLNLHADADDPCQKLFNAVGVGSYIRPHRHRHDLRAELLIAVRGRFAALTFDDLGNIAAGVCFGAEPSGRGARADAAGVEMKPEDWHTVVALEPGSVLLEVKAGPYRPEVAKEFAAWAPPEGSAEAADYLDRLCRSLPGTLGFDVWGS